jgi:hypothetical protein
MAPDEARNPALILFSFAGMAVVSLGASLGLFDGVWE